MNFLFVVVSDTISLFSPSFLLLLKQQELLHSNDLASSPSPKQHFQATGNWLCGSSFLIKTSVHPSQPVACIQTLQSDRGTASYLVHSECLTFLFPLNPARFREAMSCPRHEGGPQCGLVESWPKCAESLHMYICAPGTYLWLKGITFQMYLLLAPQIICMFGKKFLTNAISLGWDHTEFKGAPKSSIFGLSMEEGFNISHTEGGWGVRMEAETGEMDPQANDWQ